MRRCRLPEAHDERLAWCAWLALLAVLSVWMCVAEFGTVTKHYSIAARHWIDGQPLYNGRGVGFIYLPPAAILHIPFALLPHVPGEILWRLLTISAYALGLRRLCGLSERDHGIRLFPLATCVSLPLAYAAARNGQTTMLITGLTMLAVSDLVDRRWNRAATLLCTAFAFKPIGLPFLMVIGALHPPMLGRLFAGMLLVAFSPYLAQGWAYVAEQYRACAASMQVAASMGVATPWAQIFGMLEIAGLAVPWAMQAPLRAAAGCAVLALNWLTRRRLPANRYGIYLFSLTTIYLLLFNPRTENNTYAYLSPAIGLFCAEAILVERNRLIGTVLTLIALGMLGGYEVASRIAPAVAPVWLTPLMAICFLAVSAREWRHEIEAAKIRDFRRR